MPIEDSVLSCVDDLQKLWLCFGSICLTNISQMQLGIQSSRSLRLETYACLDTHSHSKIISPAAFWHACTDTWGVNAKTHSSDTLTDLPQGLSTYRVGRKTNYRLIWDIDQPRFHPSWDKLCLINWSSHSLTHALYHTHLRTIRKPPWLAHVYQPGFMTTYTKTVPIHRSQQSRQGPKLEHKPIFIPNIPHQNQCLHVRL